MLVEVRPLDLIRPHQNNPRLNDAAADAVAASLKEFGWRQPVVVDGDGVIIVGHTRYKAAHKPGTKSSVQILWVDEPFCPTFRRESCGRIKKADAC
jgi:ParB-like chromosome segregation protein Spo0J